MTAPAQIARRIRVDGRVQGVGYRDWATGEARALGLSGWVRNRRDGSVEALAIGEEGKVNRFLARLHTGPRAARVDQVESHEAEPMELSGFEQRVTE